MKMSPQQPEELKVLSSPSPAQSPAATPPEQQSQVETHDDSNVAPPAVTSDSTCVLEPEHKSPGGDRPASWPSIPGYEILALSGRGGMGIVYKARHKILDRLVALKTLRAELVGDPEQARRFEQEMRAIARLDHPHLVRVYEIGQHEGQPYFTMPYLAGGNLAEQQARYLDEPRSVLCLMEKIARAVQYAHEQGVLHRDLKLRNVLMDAEGEPRVSDFGLARICDAEIELTQTGMILGTPPYMAPEQVAGRSRLVGAATDVWALGVMLYELLVGRRPFVGADQQEVKQRILAEAPPPPRTLRPELDAGVEKVVLTCLEKEPAHRYESAAALADDLARCLRGDRPVARPQSLPRRLIRGVRQHPVRSAVLSLATIAFLALAAAATSRLLPSRPAAPAESVSLIGATGAPLKEARWIFGENDSATGVNTDGTFFLEAKKVAALELASAPPWPAYRLDAEVRHDVAGAGCDIGVFFAAQDLHSAKELYHVFYFARFADIGAFVPGRVDLRFMRFTARDPEFTGSSARCNLSGLFDSALKRGEPPSWRTVGIDVDEQGVEMFWDGASVGAYAKDRLVFDSGTQCKLIGFEGAFKSDGGLGLHVFHGKASFRNVKITKK
jgi:serine/threonine-protein kinase